MSSTWWGDVGAVLTPWLVRVTIGGVVVSLLALLTGACIRRGSAAARVAVWRAGVAALLLLPIAASVPGWHWVLPVSSIWTGAIDLTERIAEPLRPDRSSAAGRPELSAQLVSGRGPANLKGFGSSAPPASLSNASVPALTAWLVLFWSLIAGGILAYFGAGLVALKWHAGRACDVTAEVADLLPPKARLRVLRGGPFAIPGCWGVVRPTVLLPVASGHWSRSSLRAVLLHESAHVERRDPLFLLLTRAACALHWVNPLAWLIQRNLLHDSEEACDAAVLRRGVPAREYAQVLVELAAEARVGRAGLILTMSRPGGLARRIMHVLETRTPRPAWGGVAVAASLLQITVALACATVTTRPPPGDTSAAVSASRRSPTTRTAVHQATEQTTGAWDARYDGASELYVQLVDGGGVMSANHLPVNELDGLNQAFLRTGGRAVFELVRAAGTVRFEGMFDAHTGQGTYRFTPRQEFAAALQAQGTGSLPPERLLLLALQNVDADFVYELVQNTTGPMNGDLLVRAAIFQVDKDFIQQMADVGYHHLTIQDLVRLRIFRIDSTYVERLRRAGQRLTVNEMVSRRIQEKK